MNLGRFIFAIGVGIILAAAIFLFLNLRNRNNNDVAISGQDGTVLQETANRVTVLDKQVELDYDANSRRVIDREFDAANAPTPAPTEEPIIVELQEDPAPQEQPTEPPPETAATPIPTAVPTAVPQTDGYVDHYVVQGETLYEMTRRYNTTIDYMRGRGFNESNMIAGTTVRVPVIGNGGGTSYAYDNVGNNVNCGDGHAHVIGSGDTVYLLAQQHNTTIDDVRNRNALDANYTIYPGQVLCLP